MFFFFFLLFHQVIVWVVLPPMRCGVGLTDSSRVVSFGGRLTKMHQNPPVASGPTEARQVFEYIIDATVLHPVQVLACMLGYNLAC